MAKSNPAVLECVRNIVKPQPLHDLKLSVIAFLDYAGANSGQKKLLCEQLLCEIIEFGKPYLKPLPTQDKNVVFVPHENAPVVMVTSCVPVTDDTKLVIGGLNRLVERCGEFTNPIEDVISEAEMDVVLSSAQKRFGILDIVAMFNPLKILSFNNSHRIYNCECGLTDNLSRESVIFVYHPRSVSVYDRVFIFAHEVGHALHFALTGDVSRAPERFDVFNEQLGIKNLTMREQQESFADAVAIAILNSDELSAHLPEQLHKQLPPYFEKCVKFLTDDFFKKLHWQR